jgi:hypothetical protein
VRKLESTQDGNGEEGRFKAELIRAPSRANSPLRRSPPSFIKPPISLFSSLEGIYFISEDWPFCYTVSNTSLLFSP